MEAAAAAGMIAGFNTHNLRGLEADDEAAVKLRG